MAEKSITYFKGRGTNDRLTIFSTAFWSTYFAGGEGGYIYPPRNFRSLGPNIRIYGKSMVPP